MPLAVVYPATLPSPSAAQVVEVERRFLAQSPFDARAFQLDRAAQQDVTFPLMTEQQAAQFDDWWRNTLNRGGAWFAASWPLPRGLVSASRQFVGRPQYTFVAGGYWQITAQFWVRGAGLPPELWGETIIGMRMQGSPANEAGIEMLAYETETHNTPPNFVSGAVKFGTLGYRAVAGYSTQPIISGNLGNWKLGDEEEWQIKGWVKPAYVAGFGSGGYLLELSAGRLAGTDSESVQIILNISPSGGTSGGPTDPCTLVFQFASLDVGSGARLVYGLQDATPLAPVRLPLDGAHHFLAICGDADGIRAYLDTQLWMVDHDPTQPLGAFNTPNGHKSLAVNDLDNQRFTFGSACVGTYSDHPETALWPQEFAFASGFSGDVGEFWISRGLGCVEFYGDTITPPAVPAILRV